MRIDGDGNAIYQLTLLLTPDEAREVIGAIEGLLQAVPAEQAVTTRTLTTPPPSKAGNVKSPLSSTRIPKSRVRAT